MGIEFINNKENNIIVDIKNNLDQGMLFESPIYLITAADNVLNYQNELINKLDNKATFRASIFTFNRLMWHVYNEIGSGNKTQVSKEAHALILYNVINKLGEQNQLKYFLPKGTNLEDSSIRHISFAFELIEVFEKLETYCIDLNNGLLLKEKESSISLKWEDIRNIYNHYRTEIDNKKIASVNLLKDFNERLNQMNEIKSLKGAEIYIDGINELKPIEIAILNNLSSKVESIQIYSPYDNVEIFNNINYIDRKDELDHLINLKTVEVYEASNNRIEFEYVAKKVEEKLVKEKINYSDVVIYYRDDKELIQLERTFDKYKMPYITDMHKSITAHPLIQFIHGLLEFADLKYKNQHHKKFDNPHHIKYMELLIKIAKTRFLIPSVLNVEIDKIDDFVHSCAVSYGELFNDDGEFDPTYLFYKKYREKEIDTGKINIDSADNINEKKIAELAQNLYVDKLKDEEAYQKIIVDKKKYYNTIDENDPNISEEIPTIETKEIGRDQSVDEETNESIEDSLVTEVYFENFVNTMIVFKEIVDKVNIFAEKFNNQKDIKNAIKYIDRYLEENKIYSKLSGQFSYYEDQMKVEVQEVYQHVKNIIESCFIAFNETNKTNVHSIIKDIFETILEKASFKKVNILTDTITIKKIDKVNNTKYKYAFITNFDRNNMPKNLKDNGILTDNMLEQIKENTIPTTLNLIKHDDTILFNVISTADYIFISYALVNHEGQTTKASSYINKLGLENNILKVKSNNEIFNRLTSKENILLPLIEQISKNKNNSSQCDIEEKWKNVIDQTLRNKLDSYYHFYDRQENNSIGNSLAHNLYLSDEERALEDGKYVFEPSVSRYQLYNGCAFKHFANYGLKLQVREPYALQPKDIGTIQHAILEELFVSEDSKKKINVLMEEKKKRKNDFLEVDQLENDLFTHIQSLIESKVSTFANGKLLQSAYNRYQINKMTKAIFNTVQHSIRLQLVGAYKPVMYEQNFGHRSKDKKEGFLKVKPIVKDIEIEDKKYDVVIKGQIDRVDEAEYKVNDKIVSKYINVIDYKLSSKKLLLQEVLEGSQLQQFSYMKVLLDNLQDYYNDQINRKPGLMMFHPVTDYNIDVYKGKKLLKDFEDYKNRDIRIIKEQNIRASKPDGMYINESINMQESLDPNYSHGLLLLSNELDGEEKNSKDEINNLYPKFRLNDYKIDNQQKEKFINREVFNAITENLEKIYEKNTTEIFSGNTKVQPKSNLKGEIKPCKYCEYQSFCYFDEANISPYKVKDYSDEIIGLVENGGVQHEK
ncbi:PD-(D/E)XK nuclease family protein [Macrococcus equi]|uniref:PD-(D/E)XK nuclease family protein n=1 Tax=Macrococcus equi TaxID=3395462 RepID=UPI0039BDAE02